MWLQVLSSVLGLGLGSELCVLDWGPGFGSEYKLWNWVLDSVLGSGFSSGLRFWQWLHPGGFESTLSMPQGSASILVLPWGQG